MVNPSEPPDFSIRAILLTASARLQAITDVPMLEAEILLAFVLKKPRSYLYTWPELRLSAAVVACFHRYLARRIDGEPIAYLTGKKEFWTLDLEVSSATLIPRSETELLVELVLRMIAKPSINIADLGTGSGAIALAIAKERPDWRVFATDISELALAVAKKNATALELANVSFYHGDWCAALPMVDFDVIVSNPPYIAEEEWDSYAQGLAYEPRQALVSGRLGLDAIVTISKTAQYHLLPGGYLIVEHGASQGDAVRKILIEEGYSDVSSYCDLAGLSRVTAGRR